MDKVITKIEWQKRNKDRVNIYINEEFAFACSGELIYYHNLKKGLKVDEDKLSSIIKEDNYMKCKNYSLKLIEKSLKTEKYIEDKLKEKEYTNDCIKRVMEFLKSYNFIDDSRYVDLFIREKINSCGRNKIRYSLLKKGIKEELLNSKISDIDIDKEEVVAYKLAYKKYDIISKREKNLMKIYKKIWDYLIYRGYTLSVIENVVNKLKKNNISLVENKREERKYNIDEIYNIATRRYNIIIKSERDEQKIYRKLYNYLLRRGYGFEEVKKVVNSVIHKT
ncbi:recombination regulator RecX [Clostridium niameyense]|uniref:recombination regulator RecX n=1 Tax=Clostridium niameyense TaxID=1622073 RepID=UPI00067E9884|nr:recombination regulator RecX [Clostridium niameyense]